MKKNIPLLVSIFGAFFLIAFITSILGPLLPEIIKRFDVGLAVVSLLPFSLFLAYGIVSMPAGIAMERWGQKRTLLSGFLLMAAGSLLFVFFPSFGVFMISLFLIGAGMSVLQVVLNPMLRTAGGEENLNANLILVQLMTGSASFLGPVLYTSVVKAEGTWVSPLVSLLAPEGMAWVSLYAFFAFLSFLAFLAFLFRRGTEKARSATQGETPGFKAILQGVFRNRIIGAYFIAIFCYVGIEQALHIFMSEFLSVYHGCDPQTVGARTLSSFWALFTAGNLCGLFLVKLIDSKKLFAVFMGLCVVFSAGAFWGPEKLSVLSFTALGFAIAPLWSILFSLGMNSLTSSFGLFSGAMSAAVIGGAAFPLLIGFLSEFLGLKAGFVILFPAYAYMLALGLKAKPLRGNAVLRKRKNGLPLGPETS